MTEVAAKPRAVRSKALREGADVNAIDEWGWTALMRALLEAGANGYARNFPKMTAVVRARRYGSAAHITMLEHAELGV